jgi:hypothetical protein
VLVRRGGEEDVGVGVEVPVASCVGTNTIAEQRPAAGSDIISCCSRAGQARLEACTRTRFRPPACVNEQPLHVCPAWTCALASDDGIPKAFRTGMGCRYSCNDDPLTLYTQYEEQTTDTADDGTKACIYQLQLPCAGYRACWCSLFHRQTEPNQIPTPPVSMSAVLLLSVQQSHVR